MLYVVATPIGNLEDITQRALRVLREVQLIAAEDTRKTRKLLTFYGIDTPLTSFHEYTKPEKIRELVAILRDRDVALVSEAGMPGISDPGYALVSAAVENGIAVVPVPGPSAVTAALAVSGLPADQFLFLGFLPRRSGERRRLLESLAAERRTMVIFEAPHRLAGTLEQMREIWGERAIAVCRELTKLHEEVWRGSVAEALAHFGSPVGEFTLVVEGSRMKTASLSDDEVRARLRALARQGLPGREAVARLAGETDLPRRRIYRLWLELEGKRA